jgi:amino acid adenylation domain-containing protein
MTAHLVAGFLYSVDRWPSRNALVVDGQAFTYIELHRWANAIAASIEQRRTSSSPLATVFAYRSPFTYAAILGILEAGMGYVPLNPKFPAARTRRMLEDSRCSILIVGREVISALNAVLNDFPRQLTIILPDTDDATDLTAAFPEHEFVTSSQMARTNNTALHLPLVDPDSVAYLMFTSGSTGEPKGVPITHSNACSYIQYTCDRYDISEQDRFSQAFDITFDLSVHDLFACWDRGACLYCIPHNSVMLPAKFIREHELTMWFSVPSVVGSLVRVRLLPSNAFPSLRYSLFCGEPLSSNYARLWQEAAPQSVVENLYGPTEATIAISNYRWDSAASPLECQNGIVPIGWIFETQQCQVINAERNLLRGGELGELCLGGSQVTSGYWNNPLKTTEQFVNLAGTNGAFWYRTGDLVRQRSDGCLLYAGRIDQQVKVRGYRVELQEVEGVLRSFCGSEQVAAVPWPINNATAEGIVAFVSGVNGMDANGLLASCRKMLPQYMVPQKIHVLEEMPANSNGKIDRQKLTQILGGMP